MTRSVLIRFSVALAMLILALTLWTNRIGDIGRPDAEARAMQLLAAYAAQSGQPSAHFGNRRVLAFADEWEFVWAYRPCASVGELRIAVRRTGAASYVVLPDCTPVRGFAVEPKVA